ncbi:aspartate kinase [Fulvivirga sp. M361]|uniref:aspartate kinase n=1 Tax=Fulvivirga sp. M361 TaxID=2594266 RepID=UPI00117ABD6F|nr:aspartate kinase [Fulvivirga sp. M361]TRX57778.1 aspartate kinase [Fulvivirga sp. M361]
MKVFKFGGASIRSAEAIKNISNIIRLHKGDQLLVVVSAMGKTTNALEKIAIHRLSGKAIRDELSSLEQFHFNIVEKLFDKPGLIKEKVKLILEQLNIKTPADINYDQLYDQTVSIGELLSSTIISAYLYEAGISTKWVDARECIKTDHTYRKAKVDWSITTSCIKSAIPAILNKYVIITQGFIGSTWDNTTTTLGREGSDFSAAVFASCLNASSVTVWKDVPGILNGDPKLIKDAKLLSQLAYKEAAEMTYYGASVIHPKTIKPLANKRIPLYVRSFYDHEKPGTKIFDCNTSPAIPAIIIKKNQCLVSFRVVDYSFVHEEQLSVIFKEVASAGLSINIMQNSAISFSIVLDVDHERIEQMIDRLKGRFQIRYNTGLQLVTIKNYTSDLVDNHRSNNQILLEQISRNNYRAVMAE